MDVTYHYTHWDCLDYVRSAASDAVERFGGTWNTYYDHPPGYGLDATSVDFWGVAGRGDPLPEHQGDELAAWLLGQNEITPIRWLIWFGYIWRPAVGWAPYHGWQGKHEDHLHVTFY